MVSLTHMLKRRMLNRRMCNRRMLCFACCLLSRRLLPPTALRLQVDNRLGTFIAVRSFSAPPADVPRTVKTIEERAASRPAASARQIPA